MKIVFASILLFLFNCSVEEGSGEDGRVTEYPSELSYVVREVQRFLFKITTEVWLSNGKGFETERARFEGSGVAVWLGQEKMVITARHLVDPYFIFASDGLSHLDVFGVSGRDKLKNFGKCWRKLDCRLRFASVSGCFFTVPGCREHVEETCAVETYTECISRAISVCSDDFECVFSELSRYVPLHPGTKVTLVSRELHLEVSHGDFSLPVPDCWEFDVALLPLDEEADVLDGLRAELPVKGEFVFALANPYGLYASVSVGVVSAVRRFSELEREHWKNLDEVYEYFRAPCDFFVIQTDALLSPGSSGGGLFDLDGNLLGIISFAFGNFGFAISLSSILDNLM